MYVGRQTDRQIDRQTDRQTVRRTDRQIDIRHVNVIYMYARRFKTEQLTGVKHSTIIVIRLIVVIKRTIMIVYVSSQGRILHLSMSHARASRRE